MDTTKKFDGRADDYTLGRPDYSEKLIDCMYSEYGLSAGSVIADIGSGTGKFSKLLLQRGSTVYSVEPNEDMRRTAERELCGYEGFRSVAGDAGNTALTDASVDNITSAQAFHWFDTERFRAECSRIIKGSGNVFLIWNIRDNDDMNSELYDIYKQFCPDFRGFGGGIEKDDRRITAFFGGRYERVSFDYPMCYDRERFIARSLSGSYSLREGDSGFAEYMDAINSVFDRYSSGGIVTMANSSVAYIGNIK